VIWTTEFLVKRHSVNVLVEMVFLSNYTSVEKYFVSNKSFGKINILGKLPFDKMYGQTVIFQSLGSDLFTKNLFINCFTDRNLTVKSAGQTPLDRKFLNRRAF
jgi:hypothetical protein